MKSETRNCQNCKKDFIIEPDDFSFYEKIKVPAPTFCPECRMVMSFNCSSYVLYDVAQIKKSSYCYSFYTTPNSSKKF